MAEFDIGQWHVVLLHFPIVLFWTALVYDLLGAVWGIHVYPAGHWIVIVAAILAIPTVITGLALSDAFITNPYVETHEDWAIATLIYSLLHGAFRFFSLKKHFNKYLFITLSLINVILISVTAEYGGLVAFGHGLFH